MASTTAYDVAALVISAQHESARRIDKMQLQKLLYLVQGAHLEFWGEPAFRENVSAYSYGPVVATVERTYRDAFPGPGPVPAAVGGHPEQVGSQVRDTVATVLRYFGDWSGPRLAAHVKGPGSPWTSARGSLASTAASAAEIPLAAIADWFHDHGVDPAPDPVRSFQPTSAQLHAADEEQRRAQRFGVFDSNVDPQMRAIAERALAELGAAHRRGA